jgi:glycerophosphoryl diester phosphodiesterase
MIRVGHRGAAGHAPENTLHSIREGMRLKVDYVEVDIQKTLDGALVLFHDKLLDRITNSTGYVEATTYQELDQAVRVKGNERIPTLAEACELLAASGTNIMIEMISLGIVREVLKTIEPWKSTLSTWIASFHHDAILQVKNIDPSRETVALLEGSPIDIVKMARDSKCDRVGLAIESVGERVVRECHSNGIGVLVWTVNDPREIERAKRLGVDGIISDFPERI